MVTYERTHRLVDAILARNMLRNLDQLYPDFGYWFTNQCMPGILMGTDILMVAKKHEQIIGVALAKKRDDEVKLRCVRMDPTHQKSAAAIHLMENTLRELDADKPFCTVPEEMFHGFSRPFINHFGFSLSHVKKGMYRPGKLEYIFNERN